MGAETALRAADELSPFYIPADAAHATYRERVLKFGDAFAVLDHFGDAQATGPAAEGLFFEDTRYLSQLVLTIEGVRPLLLSSTITDDNAQLAADLTNPDLVLARGEVRLQKDVIHVLRRTVLGQNTLFTRFELRNFGETPARFRLELSFDADFADIFEVRGTTRPRRGVVLPDQQTPEGPVLAYRGLDGVVRRTCFAFAPAPLLATPRRASWQVELPPGGGQVIDATFRCERADSPSRRGSLDKTLAVLARWHEDRKARTGDIYTSNELFNDWVNRSRNDLDMLTTETPHGLYAYAGIPWFSTAFGRDGIITALQCLWLDPTLAAGTLRYLAAHQARALDPKADAEPGKILHETRKGEMAALGEVPFARYYGSVDSTPLFIVLAAAYWERTGDLPLIREIWPSIEAALGWMDEHGDLDGDGLLEYDRKSVNGLINQGWKDSGDSIFHDDGALAEAPIALVEEQGYAFAAWRGAATLALALDDPARARALEAKARKIRERVEEAFWLDELGTYAIALDGAKRACRVRASNAGHLLFAGLAAPERARSVAATLMTPDSFSGWGIRTVARGESRYNPMSYHNGSVWPHDNGLIALGFARYGLQQPLLQVLTGLFDAANFMELRRLPELFCGFERRPGAGPTSYPVACLPQAWASGAVFAVLGAMLGVSFHPEARQIRFTRPAMPGWLDELRIGNLRLGDAAVDLLLRRSGDTDVSMHVVRRDGPVEIVLTS